MAVATTSTSFLSGPTVLSSVTLRLLSRRRTVSLKPRFLLPSTLPSNKIPATKVQIKAARTESTGGSLGFRAPHFEVNYLSFLW